MIYSEISAFLRQAATTSQNPAIGCDFESSSMCGWTSSGSYPWDRQSGRTPSSSTGPSGANGGSYYVYTETGSGRGNAGHFGLTSPTFSSATGFDITFSHHMYGSSIGSLKVLATRGSGGDLLIGEVVGQQHSSDNAGWHTKTFTVPAGYTQVVFQGYKSDTSYMGAIAVDDIVIGSTSSLQARSPETLPMLFVFVFLRSSRPKSLHMHSR